MNTYITASMLYDFVACPHRVTMDLYGDPAKRDSVNPFIKMLWEKGLLHEQEIIASLSLPFLDLSSYVDEEKERLTWEAISRGEPLIYSGRIREADLLGEPDLLRKEGNGYIAGDIKSGAGEKGSEDLSEPKLHYAVQLALYNDILERKGISAGRRAFVWDIHGKEVPYDFTIPYGKRNPITLWDDYNDILRKVRAIAEDKENTTPAYSSSVCKFCPWYSECIKRLRSSKDLTLIPELGRLKRDTMISHIQTVSALAVCNPDTFIEDGKTVFKGIGLDTLLKFITRAKLLTTENAHPILQESIKFPVYERELFFDVEVDPMRNICYLHGFIARDNGDNQTEEFISFFASEYTPEAERIAFADSMQYIEANRPCSIYYYSKYERTIYRKLQKKYPDICNEGEIELLFGPEHSIDLYYDVVKKSTEWPTNDYSIKTLATYLGFSWRDKHPSGAASIEWFDRWVKTKDPLIRQRILEYNEDDCRALRVLLDSIRQMSRAV
jgi:predicted RecB family nuclease